MNNETMFVNIVRFRSRNTSIPLVRDVIGEFMNEDSVIIFQNVKPLLVTLSYDQILEDAFNKWGCRSEGIRARMLTRGTRMVFSTQGGIPTKVFSRVAALKNVEVKMVSKSAENINDHYRLLVNPFSARMNLRLVGDDLLSRDSIDTFQVELDRNRERWTENFRTPITPDTTIRNAMQRRGRFRTHRTMATWGNWNDE